MQCRVIDLGLVDFFSAYHLQQQIISKTFEQRQNTLILCEHHPVFTLGRRAREDFFLLDPDAVRRQGMAIIRTDRGGEVTFHGPGQLIVYPIFSLSESSHDLKKFLYKLEEVVIDLLGYFGIVANRLQGYTGVWIGERKIASVGIGVKKWVTYHGIGLNVTTDLRPFSLIKPCGLDVAMTSMNQELGRDVLMISVKQKITQQFSDEFGLTIIEGCDGQRN